MNFTSPTFRYGEPRVVYKILVVQIAKIHNSKPLYYTEVQYVYDLRAVYGPTLRKLNEPAEINPQAGGNSGMAPGPSNTGAKSSGLCISTSRIFNSLSSMGVEKVLSDVFNQKDIEIQKLIMSFFINSIYKTIQLKSCMNR